jgi:hypothetical protein
MTVGASPDPVARDAVGTVDSNPADTARRERRLLAVVWAALCLNGMPYHGLPVLFTLPSPSGQLVTQGSLLLAFFVALLLNRSGVLRPSAAMVLLSLLALQGVLMSMYSEFMLGSAYRGLRYFGFVAVLWLITPYWGRRDHALLKAHIGVLIGIIVSVVVGLALAPGAALSYEGRLSGAIWPMPPTQVAHYAAVLIGLVVIAWFVGEASRRWTLTVVVVSGGVLLGTHTRTALLALIVGLLLAAASLFLTRRRVRRSIVGVALSSIAIGLAAAPLIAQWLLRGQTTEEATGLTGRTAFWEDILTAPRTGLRAAFGRGPSDGSFAGLPIDSSWLATFVDFGLFGVTVHIMLLAVILITAVLRPPGRAQASALFLASYFLVAGFTENGLNSPSLYVMELVLAASLLARPLDPPANEVSHAYPGRAQPLPERRPER